MEEKPMFAALTIYRGRGAYLHRLEQFDKAKAAYDQAFKTNPENVPLLIGRSRACADAMQPMQAYSDAQDALKIEPGNMNARNVQARALYTMSDFERSVVMNFRGARLRRQPPYFTEGIIQGLETIQDCIGKNAGHVMLDFLPIIRQQEALTKEPDILCSTRLHVNRIPRPEDEKKMTQLQKRKFDTLSRVLANKYLGPMAEDKFFLQTLMKDRRIPSANKVGSVELKSLISKALQTLTEQQDKLRTQRPYYTIRLAERSESKYLTKVKAERNKRDKLVAVHDAEHFLRDISKCLKERRIQDLISKSERMQVFLDSKTPDTLPDKDAYIDRLYRAVGKGYLVQNRLSYKLSEGGNRRRIAFLMGLPYGRPKSFDSVIAKYPYKFVDVSQVIEKVDANLNMCENSFQRCWLLYEMSRLCTKQKNYALGKFYAKRCQAQAQEIDSATWWLNGCFALMSGEMQQGNQNDVRIAVEEAYEWTKKMQDPEVVQAFLAKCLQIVSETAPPDEFKAIKIREQQILKSMDEKSKVETAVLFKRISNLPNGRRFTVLPFKREGPLDTSSVRRSRKQRGLTVVPGKERDLPAPPKSKVAGFQKFDL